MTDNQLLLIDLFDHKSYRYMYILQQLFSDIHVTSLTKITPRLQNLDVMVAKTLSCILMYPMIAFSQVIILNKILLIFTNTQPEWVI